MHLVMDGYDGSYDKLQDLTLVYKVLDECPDRMGMTKIMPPYVFKYVGSKPEDWGLSGFVLIAESHISIHTFPEKRYTNIDVFSCKGFDWKNIVSYLKNEFEIKKITTKVIKRGIEHIKSMGEATAVVNAERQETISSLRER